MSIDEIVKDKNKAAVDSASTDKQHKEAYKSVSSVIAKHQQHVTSVNEIIKQSENNVVISEFEQKKYSFDTEVGVKVYLEEPYTIKTLPEEFIQEKTQIFRCSLEISQLRHCLYQKRVPSFSIKIMM